MCEESYSAGRVDNAFMTPLKSSVIRKGFKWTVLLLWILMSLISLDHLYSFCPLFGHLPTRILGGIAWLTFFLTIVYCTQNHLRETLLLILAFFFLGKISGPYLEPPSDPLEHLRRVYEWNCEHQADDMPRSNRGLWHYSMVGDLLCPGGEKISASRQLQRIDNVHGLLWALAAATLFVVSLRAGLPARWALLSVMISFLFLGTNRFSYFRYYSFAPSFTSLMIYWLWAGTSFFVRKDHAVLVCLLLGLLALPILWVNHHQEAAFLGFLLIIWLAINGLFIIHKAIFSSAKSRSQQVLVGLLTVLSSFAMGWLLPQSPSFRHWLGNFFVRDFTQNIDQLALFWHGWYVGPKFVGLRVFDTLGIQGIFMVLLAIPYFWPGLLPGETKQKIRIFILGVLPFLGYLIPLFHFIWLSNVKIPTYYRLCYASMFWLFFADFLYRTGRRIQARKSQSTAMTEKKGGR